MTEDERAIRELVANWMEASKAGDLDTILSLMADDVIFMVPGREPFGKEAFAAESQGMKGLDIEGTSDIEEVKVFGDRAYLRNRLTITIAPAGGQAMLRAHRPHALHPAQGEGRALAAGARRQSVGAAAIARSYSNGRGHEQGVGLRLVLTKRMLRLGALFPAPRRWAPADFIAIPRQFVWPD